MASAARSRLYDLVICGGGASGSALAHKFTRHLGAGHVCVIEPSEKHYYQPMFTLLGGGHKRIYDKCYRSMKSVLPAKAAWLQDRVEKFLPDENTVVTGSGERIEYKHLVIAIGLELRYDRVKGLPEALKEDPQVCSNYSPIYVKKTFPAIQTLEKTGGDAIFTFPLPPLKCPGAPQKIAYMADDYLRKVGKRAHVNIHYNTALPVIFGVKKYAEVLERVCKSREILVHHKSVLVEVQHKTRTAVFENLDTRERHTMQYALLHAPPPQQAPAPLKAAVGTKLVNADGFVDVHKYTLHHNHYANVWSVGDCAGLPNSKTAAAACTEAGVIEQHLLAAMRGEPMPDARYSGYASCPLITAKNKCILAEFGYDGAVLETLPVDQASETYMAYWMKADLMPWLYWNLFVTGWWNGPGFLRRLLHLGLVKA